MVKNLTAIGNSLGIIIDRAILDLLNIQRDTPLEVTTDGTALIIRPVSKQRKQRLKKAAERVMQAHNGTFKKLAK